MYLDNDAAEHLHKLLESNSRIGIAVALQRIKERPCFVQGGGCECYPTGTIEQSHYTYYTEDKPIFWGDIACAMIRKECMWDCGVLDENFIFVCSDSDYTLTARSKGWEVWLACEARGIHEKGQSFPRYDEKGDQIRPAEKIYNQIARDSATFGCKWVNGGYYNFLRYTEGDDDKPIFIFRKGELVPASGQRIEILTPEQTEQAKKRQRRDFADVGKAKNSTKGMDLCGLPTQKKKAQKSVSAATGS